MHSPKLRRKYLILCIPALVCITNIGSAAEGEIEVARDCINSRLIKSTKVLDDHNILFYMRGKDIYRNYLPKPCKGLSREKRFTYGSSFRRLCQADRIRTLVDSGFGLQQGRNCRLGAFITVSEDEVEGLINPATQAPNPESLVLPEPDSLKKPPSG